MSHQQKPSLICMLSITAITLASASSWRLTSLHAASPEAVAIGRQLFEKNWAPSNAALVGSDGLGPLFNGQSCSVCHRQGGIGGGGEAEFNAKSIGIQSMRITGGLMNLDVVRQAIRGFHPGFITPTGAIVNSLPLAHHGGTAAFAASRVALMEEIPAIFSDHGGSANAEEVRRANETPILYSSTHGGYQTTIRARMFQRNTTPLFGAGLIDRVTSKQLQAIERAQKAHPEISGRVSTLPEGRIGRFGWRGNVPTLLNFCDKACAAEVGLETRRINQPIDPMAPAYRNPTYDISDAQIRAMATFVAALPVPIRAIPDDSEQRQLAARGEQVFASVGCAVCHLPNLGPAKGIYSDLLLHDMGPQSYDLNPADPYIIKVSPITRVDHAVNSVTQSVGTMADETVMGTNVGYYGGQYSMEPGSQVIVNASQTSFDSGASKSRIPARLSVRMTRNEYLFEAQPVPPMTIRFVNHQSETREWEESHVEDNGTVNMALRRNERTASGAKSYDVEDVTTTTNKSVKETRSSYVRIHMEPTYFTQEWRTPPLWGVHDSAPYMHDGRAETLLEAITMHEGESEATRDRFLALPLQDRQAVVEFLHTLVAPPNAPQPRS
jgi:CxxC motif-containing protein (DUF1111 family)